MAYTDLSSTFVYRLLLTHQLMDQLAENDKVFNDLLTAVTDFDNNLRFNNAKYLQGEIAAGSTYKKLIGLDASNIVQLGESGTEVRVPADPTNALGVATKQYVEAFQVFQTQPAATATPGGGGPTYVTLLSRSGRGHLRALTMLNGAGSAATAYVRITIDGGSAVVYNAATNFANGTYRYFMPNLKWNETDQATDGVLGLPLLDIAYNTSILVEVSNAVGAGGTARLIHDIIP